MYKNEEISSKYFRNYKHPVDLFENLRDGNINPKEELKVKLTLNQIYLKYKKEIKNQNRMIR